MNLTLFSIFTIVVSFPFSNETEPIKNEPVPTEEPAITEEATTTATTTMIGAKVQVVAAMLPEILASNRTYLEENFKNGDYIAATDDDGNYLWGFILRCSCATRIGVLPASFGGKAPVSFCCK